IFRLRAVTAQGSANDALMAKLADARTSFRDNLGNDLNIAGSLGAVFDLIREVNASFSSVTKADAGSILDFFRTDVNGILDCLTFKEESAAPEIEALLRERAVARKAKDFKRSDEIRDKLKAMGIEIFDTPNGATWKKVKQP
ncbi:MAG: DALR domain-containing protein, partial [Spirochaetota bacterium]